MYQFHFVLIWFPLQISAEVSLSCSTLLCFDLSLSKKLRSTLESTWINKSGWQNLAFFAPCCLRAAPLLEIVWHMPHSVLPWLRCGKFCSRLGCH